MPCRFNVSGTGNFRFLEDVVMLYAFNYILYFFFGIGDLFVQKDLVIKLMLHVSDCMKIRNLQPKKKALAAF